MPRPDERRVSRLDVNILRLQAQRACLDQAAEMIAGVTGPVLELGLGNGRSYDHLRAICPGREIFVLDREVAAHPDCIPDDDHMILGDFRDTLPGVAARFHGTVALLHADVGSANLERDARLAAVIAEYLPALLRPGAMVAADRDVAFAGGTALALPDGFAAGTYFLYRMGAPAP